MSWGTLLVEALRGEPDKVPKGWLTAQQISIEIGKSYAHTRALLCQAVTCGAVERKNFRIATGSMIKPVPHYREIEAKTKA